MKNDISLCHFRTNSALYPGVSRLLSLLHAVVYRSLKSLILPQSKTNSGEMAVFGEGFLIGMRSNSAYEKRWSDGVQGQGLLASPLVAVINVSPFEDMVLSMLDQFDIVF